MIVIPFKAEHFWSIEAQPAQEYVRGCVTEEQVKQLEKAEAFSCVEGDKVLCCFGWVEVYKTRAAIWGYMSKDVGPHFNKVTRIAKRLIKGLAYKRIELEVDCEFKDGHRWARMLGFQLEAECLRGFRMDGGDSAVYARVTP